MTDLASAPPEGLGNSTVLEGDLSPETSGAGAPRTLAEEAKPEKLSLRETISEVVKEGDKPEEAPKPDKAAAEGKAKATEEKPAKAAPERGADGKFAGAEKPAEEAPADKTVAAEPKPDDKSRNIEAPAKFLPDAKETWRNTPRAVQRDVENMTREHEAEITRHREAAERYEPLRQFDELTRQHGRAGLHEVMADVNRLENMMSANPLAALNEMLQRAGPRKPDGTPFGFFEFASAVVGAGQDKYHQIVAQKPQEQPRGDPEVAQLKQQIAQMQHEQIAATVIEPFRRENPRYDELKRDIALFLGSDKIPATLSPHDRLSAAYDMAVRINPASHDAAPGASADLEPGSRTVEPDLSGAKSIKSAPGAISHDLEPERGGSTRDILRDELRRRAVS